MCYRNGETNSILGCLNGKNHKTIIGCYSLAVFFIGHTTTEWKNMHRVWNYPEVSKWNKGLKISLGEDLKMEIPIPGCGSPSRDGPGPQQQSCGHESNSNCGET